MTMIRAGARAVRRTLVAGALLAFGSLQPAAAQPQRVIRIVVPFGAGAVQDTIARAIGSELGQAMSASVIVENRAGAGGTIGTAAVARAAPDGNTLVLAGASHTLAGHLYPKLGYDPVADFVAVAMLGQSGYVVMSSAKLPATNAQEFIRLIRAEPGRHNYASAGNGSATHLGMASFLARAGLDMVHVPMKSTGEAVNEVVAGHVQAVTAATIGVIGFRNDPRVRLLAYTGRQRSKFLPEVPTAAESGVPGFEYDSWIGLLAPAGTPRPEVERLNAAMARVLADPVVQERFARLGVETGLLGPDDSQKLLRADWDRAGAIVRSSGVRLD